MIEKLYKNAILQEQLYKLNADEKQEVILELLKTRTERGLALELNIPHSTIHDWKSKRQNNRGKNIHISFNGFHNKIKNLSSKDIKDWGRLEMIKEEIERLLRYKND